MNVKREKRNGIEQKNVVRENEKRLIILRRKRG